MCWALHCIEGDSYRRIKHAYVLSDKEQSIAALEGIFPHRPVALGDSFFFLAI